MELSNEKTKYEVKFTSAMKKVVKRHYDLNLFAEIVDKLANGLPLPKKTPVLHKTREKTEVKCFLDLVACAAGNLSFYVIFYCTACDCLFCCVAVCVNSVFKVVC